MSTLASALPAAGALVAAALTLALFARGGRRHALWVAAERGDLARITQLAALAPGEQAVELGCGDGRVVAALAASEPGATVVGLELAPALAALARARTARLANARIVRGDLFEADLSAADVVYLYGHHAHLLPHLIPHLHGALRPGTRVISYRFPLPGLTPDTVDATGRWPVHLYRWDPTALG